jgi:DNA-directed RNA polymerase subunit K/omega
MILGRDKNAFEFVVVSALRAGQLIRGCTPRVPASDKVTVTARHEVAAGKISRSDPEAESA